MEALASLIWRRRLGGADASRFIRTNELAGSILRKAAREEA